MTLEQLLGIPRILWVVGAIVTVALLNDERRARFIAKNQWLLTWPEPLDTIILVFLWPLTWWELRRSH